MWSGEPLWAIKTTEHRVELRPRAGPVRAATRREEPRATEAEVVDVKRLLEADVIEPTSSEWGFTAVLVPSKDGTLSSSVEYLHLIVESSFCGGTAAPHPPGHTS